MTPTLAFAARVTTATAVMLAASLLSALPSRADAGPDTVRIPRARIRAAQLGLARADRLQHASLSFTLAAGAGLAGTKSRSAFVLAIGLGTVKELWDRRHGSFDPVDLGADAIGAALGARAGARR